MDIDHLLDELGMFETPQISKPANLFPPRQPTNQTAPCDRDADLDDLLEMLADNTTPNSFEYSSPAKDAVKLRRQSTSNTTRCDSISKCPAIRCISCDSKCIELKDSIWTYSVDYLFFRTVYPDLDKLSVKTQREVGMTAVCCMCAWAVKKILRGGSGNGSEWVFESLPQKWRCGCHSST